MRLIHTDVFDCMMKKKMFFLLCLPVFWTLIAPSQLLAAPIEKRLAGRILLAVEDHGEAWYVDPITYERTYLKDGASAFALLRSNGLGISEKDFKSLGAKNRKLLNRLSGRIVLRVQAHGEAYYIDPVYKNLTYLQDGKAAFDVLRNYGLGIKTMDLSNIPVSSKSTVPIPENDALINESVLQSTWTNLINSRRSLSGLSVLSISPDLQTSSDIWVKYLAGLQTITHTRPNNESLLNWAQRQGVSVKQNAPAGTSLFAENLGIITTGTSETELIASTKDLFNMMLSDKTGHHYQTIHDPAWTHMGIAFYLTPLPNGKATLYAVFHYANK